MTTPLADDPQWYRDAIIYELHVRSFADSNADGIGDFDGLTERLDYLQSLGVTALWILPFYPSPLRDDGYDIADYTGVNPSYGDLSAFRRFLREAHRRDLRVITELVLNHTSDMHPWFQRARRAPAGSAWRDFYVWSDDPSRYRDARIIFRDYETSNWSWDIEAKAYYWHRFYSHQPDLNFERPEVRKAMIRVVDRWLEMGVDGLRLDAVPYLYEREGTNCENLPETHGFLRELRAHVDASFPNRMLLAEANQWPEEAVAYFGDGDECHMAFHFPLMPRLFMALQMESRHPVVDILEQTPPIPDGAQWAMFLRNHDELTLEMVTDEERDYMYRRYAADPQARINLGIRRRLAPLLGNDRRKIELLNVLLFSMPGTPVVYYGDEIGMGDNVYLGDREGVRTPMQWNADRNAGFSRANPQRLFLPTIIDPEYHYEAVNVEAQLGNPNSLLWWMRRLIALRKRHPVLGRGTLQMLDPDNPKVLPYLRVPRDPGEEHLLVVANLSRYAQHATVHLREFAGVAPVELFGRTRFAPIGDDGYPLALAPHGYYWLSLGARERLRVDSAEPRSAPVVRTRLAEPSLADLLAATTTERRSLEQAIAGFLPERRWFAGKGRAVLNVTVADTIALSRHRRDADAYLVLVSVEYSDGEPDTYLLPLTLVRGTEAIELRSRRPEAVIAALGREADALVVDASAVPDTARMLVDLVRRGGRVRGETGEITGLPLRPGRANVSGLDGDVSLLSTEQSNTSIAIGDAALFKLIRRVDTGVNPDAELTRHLGEVGFRHVPAFLGSLEHHGRGGVRTLATLTGFVHNQGNAWDAVGDELDRFFDTVVSEPPGTAAAERFPQPLGALVADDPPPRLAGLAGGALDLACMLGERTAQLHAALAQGTTDDLRPERYGKLYQRSLEQSLRSEWRETVRMLARKRDWADEAPRELARRVVAREQALLARLADLRTVTIDSWRIRIHGDLHLGQVLMADGDVVFIDFEGEPARPVGERRIKRSPLYDVAGMIRSFDYASRSALRAAVERGVVAGENEAEHWARLWSAWCSDAYYRSYRDEAKDSGLLPSDLDARRLLLDMELIRKAAYEVRYELRNRPDWVDVPLGALDELTERIS